jgi:lysophospholipase L1-like esterase
MRFERFVAIGDSSTEGLEDPDGAGGYRGWADRLAARVAEVNPGLLYANLGVRGKRAREIRLEQLGPAVAMRPDLATVFAGSNDILDRRFDPDALEEEVRAMQSALVSGGAVVLSFTLPDLTQVMPIGRFLAGRIRLMNEALRQASRSTGARLLDLAAHAVGSDPRLWSEDRFHVNAEGHTRIAEALAWVLGLPGATERWRDPLPGKVHRSVLARWVDGWRWCRRHLLGRFRSPEPPEGPPSPKRPELKPLR